MALSSHPGWRKHYNKLHTGWMYSMICEPINGRAACKPMIGQDITCSPTAHQNWLLVSIPESPVDCVRFSSLLAPLSIGLTLVTFFLIPGFTGCRNAV